MSRTTAPLSPEHPLYDAVEDFALAQAADGKSERTIRMRVDAVRWLGAHCSMWGSWDEVTRADIRRFMASLNTYSPAYRNNIHRCLRPFFAFLVEDGVVSSDVMAGMKPPSIPERIMPVVSQADAKSMMKAKGLHFQSVRDTAIIMLFMTSGMRRAELHGLQVGHLDILARTAVVTGKAGKLRVVRFDAHTAQALARYLRVRARYLKRKSWETDCLWIGACGPLKLNALNQMLRMRAKRAGVAHVSPHSFRRAFSVEFLLRGGNETDLMSLNGWESTDMVRLYSRSAQAQRAHAAYDRIMN